MEEAFEVVDPLRSMELTADVADLDMDDNNGSMFHHHESWVRDDDAHVEFLRWRKARLDQ